MKFIDLVGQKFGRLTVKERDTSKTPKNGTYWICICECGNIKSVRGKDLRRGFTTSCGCYKKEVFRHETHGLSYTKTHKQWIDMRERCLNPKKDRYKNYGGRGISIYEPWINDFKLFYDYVSKLEHFSEDGYSLDRIDVNGNYEPNNIRWATDEMQRRNRTDNHYIDVGDGKLMILNDVAEVAGVTLKTIYDRLARGEKGKQLLRPARAPLIK